jgi:hypothetical protein
MREGVESGEVASERQEEAEMKVCLKPLLDLVYFSACLPTSEMTDEEIDRETKLYHALRDLGHGAEVNFWDRKAGPVVRQRVETNWKRHP